jgi:hypothetical protein
VFIISALLGKADLQASLNSLDIWLIIFGLFVAVGAVGGSVTGFLHWRRSGQLQTLLEAENLAQQREIATVNATAAQAEQRAAEATLQIARMRAPRFLNSDQQARVIDKMRPFAGQRVSVGAVPATFEAAAFGEQILHILKDANINGDLNQGAAQVQVGLAHGVVARYFTFSEKGKQLAETFAAALNQEGITCAAVDGLMEALIIGIAKKGTTLPLTKAIHIINGSLSLSVTRFKRALASGREGTRP